MRRTINYTLILILVLVGCQTTGPNPSTSHATPLPICAIAPPTGPWHICIDPGHGGPWTGAIAPSNGLRECDINLAVSLRLRDLLEAEGIQVTMTRTTDTALVLDSLSQDLLARATLANESRADLFISVHHNADIVSPSDKDDIEIYYARRDPAASKQLATHVLEELSTAFSAPENKLLLPGNYSVIRNATMPAILTETAYLTHDPTAHDYATGDSIDAEARALFRGVIQYLEKEPPLRLVPKFTTDDNGYLEIAFDAEPGTQITALHIDGNPTSFTPYNQTGPRAKFHKRLPNSFHAVTVRLQNPNGALADHRRELAVWRKPASLTACTVGDSCSPIEGAQLQLNVRVADKYGFGRPTVTISISGGETATTDDNGIAVFHVPVSQRSKTVHLTVADLTTEAEIPAGVEKGCHSVSVFDADGPVPFAELDTATGILITNEHGWAQVPPGILRVRAPGYESYSGTTTAPHMPIKLKRIPGSALHGKTILLDPLDGGRVPGAIGPTGLRASDVASDVAAQIAQRLRALGATPILLRSDDEEIGELTRITRGEAAQPNLYIGITFGVSAERARLLDDEGHRLAVPESFVAHYPGSSNGERFAVHAQQALDLESIAHTVYYPVQQMSCPAVLIQPASVRENEARLREPSYQSNLAAQIVDALHGYFTPVSVP